MELLQTNFLDNPLHAWGAAGVTGVLVLLVLRTVQAIATRQLNRLGTSANLQWMKLIGAALGRTKLLLLLIVSIYFAALWLDLPERATRVVNSATIIALLLQSGLWLIAALNEWLSRYRERQLTQDPAAVTTMSALGFVSKIVIWSAVLLLALDNLGANITALVAGLGIGGIAVALAVQNILGDLFASLSIVLDKPFVIGDFLNVGEHLGSVENIGLKTTRLRSLSGEQLVFSNSDLLSSRIRNFGRMFERRVVFTVGVTYQTPRAKLERIPGMLREAVEANDKVRFDRAHFKEYGAFSLDFETVYYVLVPEYNTYMDIQQAVLLAIHARFESEEIEFAYPTQTVYVAREAA